MKNIFPNYFDKFFCCRPKTIFFENRLEEQNNKYLVADGMRLEFCVPTIYNNKSIQCAKMVGSILCQKRQNMVACPNKGAVAGKVSERITCCSTYRAGMLDSRVARWNRKSMKYFFQFLGTLLINRVAIETISESLFTRWALGIFPLDFKYNSLLQKFAPVHRSKYMWTKLTCYPQYEINKTIPKLLISLTREWW